MLTMKDITRIYGVSRPTVYTWIKNGLPIIQFNRFIRFEENEVKEWMEKHKKVSV